MNPNVFFAIVVNTLVVILIVKHFVPNHNAKIVLVILSAIFFKLICVKELIKNKHLQHTAYFCQDFLLFYS